MYEKTSEVESNTDHFPGKTVQTISLIANLREENYLGPHLIVAPLSTLSNWMDEFEKWCPSLPVVLFHGDAQKRAEIKRKHLTPNMKNGNPTKKFPVVCTSYEMVLRERATLSKFNWAFIIIVSLIPQHIGYQAYLLTLPRTRVTA